MAGRIGNAGRGGRTDLVREDRNGDNREAMLGDRLINFENCFGRILNESPPCAFVRYLCITPLGVSVENC
jgi:hypothetical protein